MNDRLTCSAVPDSNAVRTFDQALNHVLIDSLTDYAVFGVSRAGIVVSWNAGAQNVFGYRREEIVGRSFDIFFTSQDVQSGEPRSELTRAFSVEPTRRDRWHVHKDGRLFWAINTVVPLLDPDGSLLGFTKLVRDTTPSYLAAEQLRDSEQRLRLLVESARDFALFSLAPDGTITSWGAGAQAMFGYEEPDIIGKPFDILFRPADGKSGLPRAELSKADVSGSVDIERRLVRRDGSTFLAGGKTSKLNTGACGEARGFVKLVHDVTSQHAAAARSAGRLGMSSRPRVLLFARHRSRRGDRHAARKDRAVTSQRPAHHGCGPPGSRRRRSTLRG